MATSGALSTNNDNIKYKITITQNSQNVAGNTSNVTVSVKVYRTNTGYTTYGTGTIYCKINGTTYSEAITSDDKITSSGIVLFTKKLNIAHNADGSKTLNTSAWINHSQFSASEQSFSMKLTTIPRATAPTVNDSDIDLGTSITISMPRASSSFTHTLRYAIGSSSGTIASGLGTSRAWTVPLSLASQLPNTTSGKLVIYCDTYNGSTKIGTKSVTITVRVPSTVVPTIGSVAVTDTNATQYEKMGGVVKGKSQLSVKITASGAYGSTISSYSTTAGGKTYAGATFTVNSVTSAGTLTFTVTVKDSRGRTAKTTKSINVVDYEAPVITKFSVIRANSDGTPNDEGSSLLISYAFNISPVNNKNDKTFTISMKSADGSNFITLLSGSVYSANTTLIPEGIISPDMTYTIRLKISDYFKSITHDIEAPTAFTLVDYHSSGKGIAFGKVCEREGIEFNLPLYSSYPSKVLWSGTWYMTAGHIAELSEKISDQVNGIVIVFSRIGDGVAQNDNFASFFVPKYVVAQHPNLGMNFFMAHSSFEYCGAKYLYIGDTQIKGHANNNLTGTGATGIKYENNRFIMRYVLGV